MAGVSIAELAREVGMATSTVSRALTQPGRTSEATRQKVLEAAARLGYTPNHAARNLRKGKARTVMVILPEALYVGASQVVFEVLRETADALRSMDYTLLISNVSREALTDEHILDIAFGGTVSGALLVGSPLPSAGGRSLLDAGIPVVSLFYDLTAQGIPSVVSDDRAASEEIMEGLLEKGHRSFLYVQGTPGNYHEVKRYRGILSALKRAGLPETALKTTSGDFRFSGGIQAGAAFLAMQERPTAVICCNDDMAIGLIKAVSDAGLKVPQDVSVVGFDDAPVAEHMVPGLATVRQPVADLGRGAANLVVDMIEKGIVGPEAAIMLPCTLILRNSVRALET